MLTLEARKRSAEKPAQLRRDGFIPAVYYGFGQETTSAMVPALAFIKVFREAGETTAITLDFGGEKINTLVHDIQYDPLTDKPVHVDFLVVDMKKEIVVSVPLEFIGISDAEKTGLGTVMKVLHEIEIKALPANLPHAITVDISTLHTLEDKIHVKDIALPEGVTGVTPEDETVALVAAFVEEKEEAVPIDLSSIEVEKKGKKEEDEPAE